jgi:FKBP-type peptidyl-prolyl cis-trans isomerase
MESRVRSFLCAALLLAACGSSSNENGEGPQPSAERPSPAAEKPAPSAEAPAPAAQASAPAPAEQSPPAPPVPSGPPASKSPVIPADGEVVTTASGLKYSILAPGDGGKHPRKGDPITVHYTGWLENGLVFDSSVERGEPAHFVVGELIEGWEEGLMLMSRGSRFKLAIPSELGFKDRGKPPSVPPNANLIFEVELIDFTEMPQFHAARPELQKALASGVKYEVLEPGAAELPPAGQVLVLEYAVWNTEGELLDCSQRRGGPVKTKLDTLATMQVPFLKEGAELLTVGSRLRFDVPGEQTSTQPLQPGEPPRQALVWELELTGTLTPLPVPPFKPSAPEALKSTASGLKYEVLKEGAGQQPKLGDDVQIHYAGWLADGRLFDSSYDRAELQTIKVGMSLAGLVEGLQLMHEGSVYQFTIPPGLGFGQGGNPPLIGPDAELVFYVELIKVGG